MAARTRSAELKAFGDEVTRYRENAEITITELGRLVCVSRSYVGQVESGSTRCREDFAQRVDDALGAHGELVKTWNELIRGTKYPKYFVDFAKAEGTAVQLRSYQTHDVDGPLQTQGYMSKQLTRPEDIELRMARQSRILGENAPMVYVVLEESVLYREVGSPEVMREQLEFLLEVSFRQNVCLQVLPNVFVPGINASFTIATQADRSEAVYAVKVTGGETSTDVADLARASGAFARLQAEALNVRETRVFLRKVIDERWT